MTLSVFGNMANTLSHTDTHRQTHRDTHTHTYFTRMHSPHAERKKEREAEEVL